MGLSPLFWLGTFCVRTNRDLQLLNNAKQPAAHLLRNGLSIFPTPSFIMALNRNSA